MNGHLGKDLLRVAKRITKRAAKSGRPLLDRIFCSKGRAFVTDGRVLVTVEDTGIDAEGYVDPAKLTVAKSAEFWTKNGGLVVRQGEAFTQHNKPEDGDYYDVPKLFPALYDETLRADGYHDPIIIDPVVLIDALDAFSKKGTPNKVRLFIPHASKEEFRPFVLIGEDDGGRTVRALIAPIKEKS